MIQLFFVASFQELQIAGHHSQRLLEIVGRHVGELLQLGVGTLQFQRGLGQRGRLPLQAIVDILQLKDWRVQSGQLGQLLLVIVREFVFELVAELDHPDEPASFAQDGNRKPPRHGRVFEALGGFEAAEIFELRVRIEGRLGHSNRPVILDD